MANNAPIIQKRDHNRTVSIFENSYTNQYGEVKTRYSVAIQRSYKDQQGQLTQSSINCFAEDLLPFSSLMENAYIALNEHINNQRKANRGNAQTNAPANAGVPSASTGPAQTANNDFDDDIPF